MASWEDGQDGGSYGTTEYNGDLTWTFLGLGTTVVAQGRMGKGKGKTWRGELQGEMTIRSIGKRAPVAPQFHA